MRIYANALIALGVCLWIVTVVVAASIPWTPYYFHLARGVTAMAESDADSFRWAVIAFVIAGLIGGAILSAPLIVSGEVIKISRDQRASLLAIRDRTDLLANELPQLLWQLDEHALTTRLNSGRPTPEPEPRGERMTGLETPEMRNQMKRWVEEGQSLLGVVLGFLHEHEQLRELANTTEREREQLRQEVAGLRAETEQYRSDREKIADSLSQLMNEVVLRLRTP